MRAKKRVNEAAANDRRRSAAAGVLLFRWTRRMSGVDAGKRVSPIRKGSRYTARAFTRRPVYMHEQVCGGRTCWPAIRVCSLPLRVHSQLSFAFAYAPRVSFSSGSYIRESSKKFSRLLLTFTTTRRSPPLASLSAAECLRLALFRQPFEAAPPRKRVHARWNTAA